MLQRRPGFATRAIVALAVCCLALGACETGTSDTDLRVITLDEAKDLHAKASAAETAALFIDPRAPARFDAAHIAGARNVSLADAPPESPRLASLKRYGVLVIYGEDPADALAKGMAKRLMSLDYARVRWFAGGLREWAEDGQAIEGAPTGSGPP